MNEKCRKLIKDFDILELLEEAREELVNCLQYKDKAEAIHLSIHNIRAVMIKLTESLPKSKETK